MPRCVTSPSLPFSLSPRLFLTHSLIFLSPTSSPWNYVYAFSLTGLLGAIHDFLPIGINIITWEAPFSLDLTNVATDLLYCLDMYNVTCGERVLKTSDCDVNETHYIISPDMNYVFELAISARSNVPNSGNGTSFSRKGTITLVK